MRTQDKDTPISQEKSGFRANWPIWLSQMPRLNLSAPNEDFQLIDQQQLDELLKDQEPDAITRIKNDIQHMDYELLRLFRELDYQAKLQQNRYRLYQIAYMLLAFLATLAGAGLALSLSGSPRLAPWFAFSETIVALMTTFLATTSGREPPLALWLNNRRRAEAMRREYFRYLMNLPPYDKVTGYKREMLLSRRAADINRGAFSDQMQEVS